MDNLRTPALIFNMTPAQREHLKKMDNNIARLKSVFRETIGILIRSVGRRGRNVAWDQHRQLRLLKLTRSSFIKKCARENAAGHKAKLAAYTKGWK